MREVSGAVDGRGERAVEVTGPIGFPDLQDIEGDSELSAGEFE